MGKATEVKALVEVDMKWLKIVRKRVGWPTYDVSWYKVIKPLIYKKLDSSSHFRWLVAIDIHSQTF